jgi:hypothetical protein
MERSIPCASRKETLFLRPRANARLGNTRPSAIFDSTAARPDLDDDRAMERMRDCPFCAHGELEVVVVEDEPRVLAVRCLECGAIGPRSRGPLPDPRPPATGTPGSPVYRIRWSTI